MQIICYCLFWIALKNSNILVFGLHTIIMISITLIINLKEDTERRDSLHLFLGEQTRLRLMCFLNFYISFNVFLLFFNKVFFFFHLNSHISSFKWNKKLLRINKNILQRPCTVWCCQTSCTITGQRIL